MNIDLQRQMIAHLQSAQCFDHPVTTISCIETHISWVLLTGDFAYKIKKAVDFGFLDFSTLAKRKFYCEEELRLNGRFSEDLYLEVVTICGEVEQPRINGRGPVLDYAVKMRQFSQDQLIEACIRRGEVQAGDIESMALMLADFHATKAARLPADAATLGSFAAMAEPALDNFSQIAALQNHFDAETLLTELQGWTESQLERLKPVIEARRDAGCVVECHGDLHLGNIAVLDGNITFFDGIEFSERLRWIDTQSELAYLLMDLEDKGYPEWANRLLNVYLEASGDYAGLVLLPLYKVYRALVRAKVNALRAHQADTGKQEAEHCRQAFLHYVRLARSYTHMERGFLAITHGVSGSGKTYLSTPLLDRSGAIRLRSDVERKRLFKLSRLDTSGSSVNAGIYTRSASEATYQRLEELAELLLAAGYAVIVDATFLQQRYRQQFRDLANRYNVVFRILHCDASEGVLRERIRQRQQQGSDVSEAGLEVLEQQLRHGAPLEQAELADTVHLNADTDLEQLLETLRRAPDSC